MIAVSWISKIRRFIQYLKCEFIEGHEWVVVMSPANHHGGYDVLLQCRKCGKMIWKYSPYRLKQGYIIKDYRSIKRK